MKYYYVFVEDGDGYPSLVFATSSKEEALARFKTQGAEYNKWMDEKEYSGNTIFDYEDFKFEEEWDEEECDEEE